MRPRTSRYAAGVVFCLLVLAGGCSDTPTASGPDATAADDALRGFLVEMGFRPEMITDLGDDFVVEGDIVITKEGVRRWMRDPAAVPTQITPRAAGPDRAALEQWRTTLIAASAYAERVVVDLSGLSTLPTWVIAARQAMQDWNAVSGSWLRFVEGAPADIRVYRLDMDGNTAARASWPADAFVTGKTGPRIEVNGRFSGVNTAGTRRRNMAHEFGHTVGLRHSNWFCYDPPGCFRREAAGDIGAQLIPGTPERDDASVMNGGTANTEWQGFSAYDQVAIRTLYPTIGLTLTGTSSIGTAGNYTWTAATTGGSGQFTYQWVRQNTGGYTTPYVVGTSRT
ncbi:MAG TPA: M57 family metalloprotease, partial [Gemmatimonadaceae bacterium]|nr:M57 family metalloprotease [Gemmatimonadaceae bacterium]